MTARRLIAAGIAGVLAGPAVFLTQMFIGLNYYEEGADPWFSASAQVLAMLLFFGGLGLILAGFTIWSRSQLRELER